MAKVGYARVSSTGQSLKVQLDKLTHAKCEKVYREKKTGVDGARPQLKACLDYVRQGDTLVITRLDRLARSTLHLHKLHEDLKAKGVALEVLDQAVNTGSSTGRLLFGMLALIAQFETELRAERQADGIAKAKERGVKFGRRAALTKEQVDELRARRKKGELVRELMREFGISKSTAYSYLDARR